MNLRLDSLQQAFSNGLTTNLEASSRGIVAAIAQVKDETRARIDDRLDVLTRESRGAFDTFREGVERQVSGARVETQDSFKKFSDTLDLRSGSFPLKLPFVLVAPDHDTSQNTPPLKDVPLPRRQNCQRAHDKRTPDFSLLSKNSQGCSCLHCFARSHVVSKKGIVVVSKKPHAVDLIRP